MASTIERPNVTAGNASKGREIPLGRVSDVFTVGFKTYWGACKLTYYQLSFGKTRKKGVRKTIAYIKNTKDTEFGMAGFVGGICAYWTTAGAAVVGAGYGAYALYNIGMHSNLHNLLRVLH